MFKMMIRRSMFNARMAAVVAGICFIYFYELLVNDSLAQNFLNPQRNINILDWHITVYGLSYFSITAGLFPAVPYGLSVMEERNCGYLRYQLQRMSWKRYINQKLIFSGISGACTMIFSYVLLIIPLALSGVPATVQNHPGILETMSWGKIMYIWGGYFYVLLKGVLLIFFGICWAELGVLFSLLIRNRYMAYIAPFIFFELMWLIGPKNGKSAYYNPVFMLRGIENKGEPIIRAFLLFVLYTCILCIASKLIFRWQVRHGKI